MSGRVIAIMVSDLHWSETAPVARSVESGWLMVQQNYMTQLRLQATIHKCPIFMIGDLFNKWNSTPYLISHVLEWLRGMEVYAIPGNHDLPQHNYKELPRSAYWTLVEAGAIKHLTPGRSVNINDTNLIVSVFPHGFEVRGPDSTHDMCLHIALVHDYIWTEGKGHGAALEEQKSSAWMKKLKGYDAAFFGDNHTGFLLKSKGKPNWILNCGTFIRRHVDEKGYKPSIGLLHSDGTISRYFLNTDADSWLDLDKDVVAKLEKGLNIDLSDFVEELSKTHSQKVDLVQVGLWLLKQNHASDQVSKLLLTALGGKK